MGGGYYHNDQGDTVAEKTVQDFPDASNVDYRAYIQRRPSLSGDLGEQGNIMGDGGGPRTATT